MFMNGYPNSDLEQCTELKLGRVHRVHTLNPGYVQAARTGPCRGA